MGATSIAGELNAGQRRALDDALAMAPGDLLLIQGPPGTGKTSLIAHLARRLLLRDFWRESETTRPVLILANTHRACNEVVLKLHDRFPDLRPYLLRLGPVGAGMEPAVREHVITERLDVRKRLDGLHIAKDGPAALNRLVRQGCALLDEALIFVGTLASAARPELRGLEFSTIIVDETGQATEAAVLQSLRHAARGYQSRLILVGDHCQLPPVVPEEIVAPPLMPAILEVGLDPERGQRQSLFERLARRMPDEVITLGDQYRMCGPISALVSATFYDGRLRPGTPAVAARNLGQLLERVGGRLADEPFARAAFEPHRPVVLVDTSADQAAGDTVSLIARAETRDNPREAVIIADLVAALLGPLAPGARAAVAREIGIISPYRKQNNRIRQELAARLAHLPGTDGQIDTAAPPPAGPLGAAIVPTVSSTHRGTRAADDQIDRTIPTPAGPPGDGPPILCGQIGAATPSPVAPSQPGVPRPAGARSVADLIRVDTVDRFQGGECDIVLLSLVASNPSASIGALHADWRRMNVAISRARAKLIVVGNRRTFTAPSTPEEEPAKERYRALFGLLDEQAARGVAQILEPPP